MCGYTVPTKTLRIESFRPSLPETQAWNLLEEDIHMCMLLKHGGNNATDLPSLQSLLNCVRQQSKTSEESKVVYVHICSERADSKITLNTILSQMYETFVIEQNQKWLIVVGDAKTYDIVRSIRSEYGEQMKWVIPWPGDWHMLLNYQKVIMKAYADAGLVTLGEATQHRSETLTSLIQCTHFRRTHNFLIQVMETFYRFFLSLYLKDKEATTTEGELLDQIQQLVG